MQYFLERKKLKYFLKHGILNFNKSRIRNSKKRKWFRLKNRASRKKFLLKRFKKSKLFPRIFLKRNFRDTMLVFKKIRSVFMDNRKKTLRRFFSKNTDLMLIYQNKLKYSLKDSFFVESLYSAKQHIKHKRIFVNGVPVIDPGFLLKNTDIVSLKNRGKTKTKIKYFKKC
jgi:ribosomal protein S4